MRTILVPLDGSSLAERALPFAEVLARASGARLVLPRASLVRHRPEPGTEEARIAADEGAELDRHVALLGERGVAAEGVLRFDEAAEAIVSEAETRGADLIVMATHGRGGLGRWVYGSVAEAVLTRTATPVLLVRAWVPQEAATRLADRPRVLVPTDGSDFAAEALPTAAQLAATLEGELVVLHAAPRAGLDFGPDRLVAPLLAEEQERFDAEGRQVLERVAAQLANEGLTAELVLRTGSQAETIEATGREFGAALVVMTTHGYTGLSRAFLGSVADATIRHGTLPLVLVRPRAIRDAAGDR